MPARLLIAARFIGVFVLAIAIALIFVRWRFPIQAQPVEPSEGFVTRWRRILAEWRRRHAGAKEKEESSRALKGTTALLVDPDDKSARVMSWKLESLGCKALRARNGRLGLNLARRPEVGFVIADALLPDISATDFHSMLPRPDLPVVFVGVMPDQRRELRALGGNVACLPKPYDPEEATAAAGRMTVRASAVS